ncbi:MAG: hypothetical protein KDA22_04745 [Phycisphaerales bacterium]|nr:hypothetical protein [Phycisphaerales bacterium]
MRSASIQPRLRLVGDEPVAPMAPMASVDAARRRAVAEENVAAAHNLAIDPSDPRWRVALAAAGLLDGAALAPDRRQRVLRTARELGVRLFDANLIIAVVQDAARSGRPLETTAGTLAFVQPGRAPRTWPLWIALGAAVLAALGVQLMLVAWLTG